MVKCFGIFGICETAYFDSEDKVGVRIENWTREQRDAVERFGNAHDDTDTKEWTDEMIAKWDTLYPTMLSVVRRSAKLIAILAPTPNGGYAPLAATLATEIAFKFCHRNDIAIARAIRHYARQYAS